MKNKLLNILVIIMLVPISLLSQNIQMEHWYINTYYNSIDVDFTSAPATNPPYNTYDYLVTDLPTQPTYYNHTEGGTNGMYDPSGNLIFYVEGGAVYDKNGVYKGAFQHTGDRNINEIAIIPKTNTCLEYYVIMSTLGEGVFHPRVFYGLVTLDINHNVISITDKNNLGGYYFNSDVMSCSFAVSNSINNMGDKYLYVVEGTNYYNSNYYGYLKRYLITDNGITFQQTLLDGSVSGQKLEYSPFEVELNHDGTKIAWGDMMGPKHSIYVVDLNGTNSISEFSNGVAVGPKGIEFSPDGSKLFFAEYYGDIKYIDFNDNNQVKVVDGLSAAICRHIELAPDGLLYCMGSSINPNTLLTNEKKIPSNYFYGGGFYHTVSPLPDQIDGFDYSTLSRANTCCIEQNHIYTTTTPFYSTTSIWNPISNPFQMNMSNVSTQAGFTISAGTKVTISGMHIEFGPYAKVIVEPGGTLILDNTVFTSVLDCPSLWPGVEVWGNRNQSQNQWTSNGLNQFQGRIIVKSNSQINNARTAIQAIKENMNGSLDWNKTGGIIQVYGDSKFINNKKSIWIGGYKNYFVNHVGDPNFICGNRSYILNSTFDINDNFNDGVNFHSHIALYDGSSVLIMNNNLYNSATVDISDKGIGIISIIAPMVVNGNSIVNFKYGIKAISFDPDIYYSINYNQFSSCYNGIYSNHTWGAQITSNDFWIPQKSVNMNNDPYGLYLNGDKAYHAENNTFSADFYPGPHGIIANEHGAVDNELYRNHFVGLNYGIQPQLLNKGVINGNHVGLKLFCNDFANNPNDYDVLVLGKQIFDPLGYKYMGIADAQKIKALNDPLHDFYPAGNTFSDSHNGGTFDLDNTQGDYLVYSHENNTAALRYKPEYSANIGKTQSSWGSNERCPSKLGGGGDISSETALLTQAQLEYNSAIVIRNIWKDGGQTNLDDQVETTQPWDVYVEFNNLIAKSPYLSDEVLMATIENPAFTSLMIKLIMVANPHATHNPEIMEAIYNRIPALPQSYIDAIEAGESSISQLELLEADVSASYHLVRSIENNIIDIYRRDTVNANAYTNMLSYMIARPGLQDKYILAATYLAHNDYTNMQSVLDAISTTFNLNNKELLEYQNSLTTFAIAKDIKQNDKHMGDLSETQLANLETIVNQPGSDHAMALALLVWNNPDYELNELILHKPESSARIAKANDTKRPQISSVFSIFPNPAKDYFTLQYNSDLEQMQDLMVIITDMQGKTIRQIKFDNSNIDELIDVKGFSAGLYSVSLYSGSLLLEVKQINIVK